MSTKKTARYDSERKKGRQTTEKAERRKQHTFNSQDFLNLPPGIIVRHMIQHDRLYRAKPGSVQ